MEVSLLTKTYQLEDPRVLVDLQANLAGAPCPMLCVLPHGVEGPDPAPTQANPLPLCHQEQKIMKKKYVDDRSLLEAIDLKSMLVPSTPIFGPPNLNKASCSIKSLTSLNLHKPTK